MSGERARAARGRRRRARTRALPPLPRRRTDHVEDLVAWLLMSLGLLAVLGSVVVGQAAHDAALGQAAVASPVRAALPADAVPPATAPVADQRIPAPRAQVPVGWTGADGVVHTATVTVAPSPPAGPAVTRWVDGGERVVADPAGRAPEAWAFGISAALTVVVLSWGLLTQIWSTVQRLTAARNAAAWAREWARVEPRWRRSMQ
jgi:hypothetical protein